MPLPFYDRLAAHFVEMGKALRGESSAAAIFPNPSDVGGSREALYVDFLRRYAPSNCNVDLGGFVFDVDGTESKQIDVIVTASNVPRFKPGPGKEPKAFSYVIGTVAVACLKSHLDKKELLDALENLQSVPFPTQLKFPETLRVSERALAEMPFRILYAPSSIARETLQAHFAEWVASPPAPIVFERLPHIIHVAGQYVLRRQDAHVAPDGSAARLDYAGEYGPNVDAIGLGSVVQHIQNRAILAHLLLPDVDDVFERMFARLRERAGST